MEATRTIINEFDDPQILRGIIMMLEERLERAREEIVALRGTDRRVVR